jgi:hypothetical protein
MKVFLSWSGSRSNKCASLLKEWLPNVIQVLDPWMSAEDVQKGAPWLKEINSSLASAQGIGIFCVTPENVRAPWLTFEAGFLAAAGGEARVCVVALGLDVTDVPAPLNLFQATKIDAADFKRLVSSLNQLTGRPLPPPILDRAFITHWPRLEEDLRSLAAEAPSTPVEPKRTQDQLLHELVESNRRIESALAGLDGFGRDKPTPRAVVKHGRKPRADVAPLEPQPYSPWQHRIALVCGVEALQKPPSDKRTLIELGHEILTNAPNLTAIDVEILKRRIDLLTASLDANATSPIASQK